MSRRKLPLDGSDWVPLAVVIQLFHERSGSLALGEADTMQALCENKVRSMCRCLGAQPERWLVPSGFWNNHEIFSTSDGVEVIARSSGAQPFGRFFCWQPDLKKFFGDKTEPTKQPAQVQEVPVKRGRPREYEHAELGAVAYALAVHKKQGEPEKKQAKIIEELRAWCKQDKRKVPGDSTLAEIVSAALRIRKKLKQRPIH
jgi:hypothetical protein